ncbi:MAG: hypothetical protein GXY33_17850 [Phycisphaerae bacterium]|nr:hypothetical protein [Phycisphaerae bacterium]
MRHKVWIVPHTHYDAEVFLTREKTIEIGISILVDALRLLRAEPRFRFLIDQVSYIDPFLKAHPEEREFFLRMVREGRLAVVGGVLVMPDLNIPSGESFIRQVMWGKEYCRRELGVEVRCSWTIDSFGRHPQLPQLLVGCGFDHDVFQRVMVKDSPSEFLWEGIDGTRILCHWMPLGYAVLWQFPDNAHQFGRFLQTRLTALVDHAVTEHVLLAHGPDLERFPVQLLRQIEDFRQHRSEYEIAFATPGRKCCSTSFTT